MILKEYGQLSKKLLGRNHKMSFTQEVKHEVANTELGLCCQKAETAALIQLSSSMVIKNHKFELSIKTENATTANSHPGASRRDNQPQKPEALTSGSKRKAETA